MDRKFLKSYILVFLIVMVIFAFESCDRRGFRFPPRRPHPEKDTDFLLERFARDLDLTEEQREKLDKIKDEIIEKRKERREKLREEHEEFMDKIVALVKSDKISKEQIYEILEIRDEKMEEMNDFLIDKLIEVHEMLTTEQREKIAEKLETFHWKFPTKF